MIIGIIIVIVAVVGALVIAGYENGKGGNPTTTFPPSDTTSIAGCQQACAAWDAARQMQCNARADEQAARARADAVRTQMLAFTAAGVSLGIAGGVALAAAGAATATIFGIPLAAVLYGVAAALFVLAAAATAAAAYFAGQLINAELDVASKSAARAGWDGEVARTRNAVNTNCSLAEANACLSRTAPC
jgi:hypothetical protein